MIYTGHTLQCLECAWRFIHDRGHCYMFKDAPTGVCMKRRPHLGKPVEVMPARETGVE